LLCNGVTVSAHIVIGSVCARTLTQSNGLCYTRTHTHTHTHTHTRMHTQHTHTHTHTTYTHTHTHAHTTYTHTHTHTHAHTTYTHTHARTHNIHTHTHYTDDSLGEIENERSRENGALLTAAKGNALYISCQFGW